MPVSNQTPPNVANDYATIAFVVKQLTSGMATATLVRVQACTNSGGLVAVGTVDLQLLVDMITEDGQTIPHGTVFKAPYQRMQGGSNAVILDPEPGDLGVCVFASRDISAIKADPNAARNRAPTPGGPPGSRRTFSLSDALYIGGMLNGVPVQFIQFNAEGVTVKSPTAITLEAPAINLKGVVTQTNGNFSIADDLAVGGNATVGGDLGVTGNMAVTGSTIGNGVNLNTHVHSGVTAGSDDTGPPA
jgi:hypothetical protein